MDLPDWFSPVPPWVLVLAAVALVVLLVGVRLLLRVLGGRSRQRPTGPEVPGVDLGALDSSGPPPDGPRLELYGTPVRLAVLVLAPVGRGNPLPAQQQLPEMVDQWIPGLMQVVLAHQPVFRRWPEQLSSQGFTQAFFNKLALPGDRGKGTPWCSVAGKLEVGNRQFLAGLILAADRPNSLSQFVVQHAGQWPDMLRVREA